MHNEYYKSGDNIIVLEDNGKKIEYSFEVKGNGKQNGF